MYERFTDRARKVMQLANQEALRFRHEYIGTEHVLLGLTAEGSGVAANVLKNLDIDLLKLRREVEKIIPYDPNAETVATGRLPHTPRTKKVVEHAIEEARSLDHNYVGTEHLLLGLLREEEGLAAQVLTNLGLKLGDVREEVLNLLGHNMPKAAAPAPSVADQTLPTAAFPPLPLTDVQLWLVRDRVRRLGERAASHAAARVPARAAKCRDEADALMRLLAWYEWFREQR
jgi:ATP-dependent Clp protease ATP-binding subunit ClpA